jgi:hypothetical protein
MLEIMRQQEVEIERLTAEKDELSKRLTAEKDELMKRLEERQITLDKAGSIAEASLTLSGVFQAAQNAADLYLENIKALGTQANAKLASAEDDTRQIKADILSASMKMIVAMKTLLDKHSEQIAAAGSDFEEMIVKADLIALANKEEPAGLES